MLIAGEDILFLLACDLCHILSMDSKIINDAHQSDLDAFHIKSRFCSEQFVLFVCAVPFQKQFGML